MPYETSISRLSTVACLWVTCRVRCRGKPRPGWAVLPNDKICFLLLKKKDKTFQRTFIAGIFVTPYLYRYIFLNALRMKLEKYPTVVGVEHTAWLTLRDTSSLATLTPAERELVLLRRSSAAHARFPPPALPKSDSECFCRHRTSAEERLSRTCAR